MAVTEETRHRLYRHLEEVLGPEEATKMMELVPQVGWGDVATKRDIDVLGGRLDGVESRMGRLEERMSEGFVRIHRDMRLQLYWLLGFFASATGVVVAVTASS